MFAWASFVKTTKFFIFFTLWSKHMLLDAHQASIFFLSRKKNNLTKIIIINNLTLFPESKDVFVMPDVDPVVGKAKSAFGG